MTDDNGSPGNIKVGILEFYGVAVIYKLSDALIGSCVQEKCRVYDRRFLWKPHQEVVKGRGIVETSILVITNFP